MAEQTSCAAIDVIQSAFLPKERAQCMLLLVMEKL